VDRRMVGNVVQHAAEYEEIGTLIDGSNALISNWIQCSWVRRSILRSCQQKNSTCNIEINIAPLSKCTNRSCNEARGEENRRPWEKTGHFPRFIST
jgi:hypothetical protein